MQIDSYVAQLAGKPKTEIFFANPPLVVFERDGEGDFAFPVWNLPGVAKPTAEEIAVALSEPEPMLPATVPEVISDRQFFQQLAINGDITQDDALAAVTVGTLPKKLSDAIAALPAAQQFPAKMLVCGATEFHRSNPMVPVLGQALGKDAAALDAIWIAGSAL